MLNVLVCDIHLHNENIFKRKDLLKKKKNVIFDVCHLYIFI
jgi:hypothetical protein